MFHDSLLPAYRGFSPTVWAIINGEDHTGVSLFHASEAYDTGDIIAQQRVPITPDETIGEVVEHAHPSLPRCTYAPFPQLAQWGHTYPPTRSPLGNLYPKVDPCRRTD
ncbi:MAG UNVERIFIED_CONTAM: hypothetical protein LVT10_20020 [Anaerolineae bacterium]